MRISQYNSEKRQLSKESAVNVCKVYGPYIIDILRQVEEVIKLFSMEKELRKIRNRGEFPVHKFTPDGIRIMNTKDKDRVLTQVDREVEDILRAVRRNEEKYEKEQEEAKNRDQQLRLISRSVRITHAGSLGGGSLFTEFTIH